MNVIPRVVIAAPAAGQGKTAVAVGLLAALRAKGRATAAFKIGPDQVDAGYLGHAAGRAARTLDPVLTGAHRVGPLFLHGARGADLAVLEGARGLYDEFTGQPDPVSTAAVISGLRAPVLLVVDASTLGRSVAALVQGFRLFDPQLWLAGVILNRVSSRRHETVLRAALAEIEVPVFGVLRAEPRLAVLPGRAGGTGPVLRRTVEVNRAVRALGAAVADGVDLARVLGLARSAGPLPGTAWSAGQAVGLIGELAGEATADLFGPGRSDRGGWAGDDRPVVAVAAAVGGVYGYPEQVELLDAAGAQVVAVDPLSAERLPAGTRGLVLGGGLPEADLDELATNSGLLSDIAALAASGGAILAEGAGLAVLGQRHDGRPMAGVLPTETVTGDRVVRGYRTAVVRSPSPLLPVGSSVVGYKRHRVLARPRAGVQPAYLWQGGGPEGFVQDAVFASQLCPHWAGVPHLARRFVAAAGAGPGSMRVAS